MGMEGRKLLLMYCFRIDNQEILEVDAFANFTRHDCMDRPACVHCETNGSAKEPTHYACLSAYLDVP